MKAKPCTVYANNRWGYCYQPLKCKSIKDAKELVRNAGFFFARIVPDKVPGTTEKACGRVIRMHGRY